MQYSMPVVAILDKSSMLHRYFEYLCTPIMIIMDGTTHKIIVVASILGCRVM